MRATTAGRLAAACAFALFLAPGGALAAGGLSLTYRGYNAGIDSFCFTVSLGGGQQSAAGFLRRTSPSATDLTSAAFTLPNTGAGAIPGRSNYIFVTPTAPNSTDVFTAIATSGVPGGATSGTATGNTNRPNECTALPPEVVPPTDGGGPIQGAQRNLERLVGGALFERGYQISEYIGFGFTRGPGAQVAGDPQRFEVAQAGGLRPGSLPARAGTEDWRWNAWVVPRYLNLSDGRSGRDATGDFGDLTGGVDYRVSDDIILGAAFGGETLNGGVKDAGLSINTTGLFFGPYLGWKLRPTTVFDIWAGYARSTTNLSAGGEFADFDTDRFFVSTNIAEIITTSWGRILPRARYFWSRAWADSFTSSTGVAFAADRWNYSFAEATVEFAAPLNLGQATVYPYVRPGLRYELERPVGEAVRTDGSTTDLERLYGQMRVGVRAALAKNVEVAVSAGYLSFFVDKVDVYEARALVSVIW